MLEHGPLSALPDLAPARPPRLPDRLQALAAALAERGDWLVAICVVWAVFLAIQAASANIFGIDGYYHIRFAWLMRQHGLRLDFPWLPLTILNPREFTDHHLLYHVLLIPFTLSEPVGGTGQALRLGAKAAGLTFGALAVLATYLVLRRLRVRYPLLWLLALLGSGEWFLARQSMTRRQSVALALLVLATYLLVTRRTRWLVPVAFAYAWVFDGFVLLLAVAGIAFVAGLVAERRPAWGLLGWTTLGLALSQVLHPYFPNNIAFTLHHVLAKVAPDPDLTVGREWYPYPPLALLETSWLALLLGAASLVPVALAPRRVLRDRTALLLGGVAFMFVVLYLRSRRFIESEPAFAVLFCAYVWTFFPPLIRGRPLFDRLPMVARAALPIAVLLGLGLQTWLTVLRAQQDLREDRSYTTFEVAARWVEQHSAPGERVYQTDWDDFPELFFWDTSNTYIVGLDPTYLYLQDPELYRLWRSIGRGQVARPGPLIRDRFGSRWVITDREHREFLAQAAIDPDLAIVFETPTAVVLRVSAG